MTGVIFNVFHDKRTRPKKLETINQSYPTNQHWIISFLFQSEISRSRVFPRWISPSAHNALIGCMRCQSICPANRSVISLTGRLEEVTEEETSKILNGIPDQKLLDSLSKKLRDPIPPGQQKL